MLQANAEKAEVETFIAGGREQLGNAAASIEEIGTARANAKQLMEQLPGIMELRQDSGAYLNSMHCHLPAPHEVIRCRRRTATGQLSSIPAILQWLPADCIADMPCRKELEA